jgi:hypothetical protein
MKLLVMQLCPPSRHSIPLWSKYYTWRRQSKIEGGSNRNWDLCYSAPYSSKVIRQFRSCVSSLAASGDLPRATKMWVTETTSLSDRCSSMQTSCVTRVRGVVRLLICDHTARNMQSVRPTLSRI